VYDKYLAFIAFLPLLVTLAPKDSPFSLHFFSSLKTTMSSEAYGHIFPSGIFLQILYDWIKIYYHL